MANKDTYKAEYKVERTITSTPNININNKRTIVKDSNPNISNNNQGRREITNTSRNENPNQFIPKPKDELNKSFKPMGSEYDKKLNDTHNSRNRVNDINQLNGETNSEYAPKNLYDETRKPKSTQNASQPNTQSDNSVSNTDDQNKTSEDKKNEENNPQNNEKSSLPKNEGLPEKDEGLKESAKNVPKTVIKDKAKTVAKDTAKKGAEAVGKFLAKNPYVLAFVGIVALILLLLLLLMAGFSGNNHAYGSTYCGGKSFDISDIANISSPKTYTGIFEWAWDKTSGQYKFYEKTPTYVDKEGFLRTGEDYIIALGEYFGTEKGTRYLIEMESGQTFTASLGDTKSKNDPLMDKTLRYHKSDGYANILEFEMGCGTRINPKEYGFNFSGPTPRACGNVDAVNKVIRDKFPGNVKSIQLLEDDAFCVESNGEFPIRTKPLMDDISAVNRILKIAPNTQAQYNGYKYECATYAKFRSIEIVDTSSMSSNQKDMLISKLNLASGNGWMWTANYIPSLKNFGFDSSCKHPKAGSIMAFAGRGATCTPSGSPETGGVYCGHVVIIEKVYKDGTVLITEGANSFTNHFNKRDKISIKELEGFYGACRGITYLFEYNGGN